MRIIVTRPRLEANIWVDKLRLKGMDALALPLIQISAYQQGEAVAQRWHDLAHYKAVMFVSSNAVNYFFNKNSSVAGNKYTDLAIKNIANKFRAFKGRFWTPGPGTSHALMAQSVPAELIDAPATDAQQFDSEALWSRVKTQITGGDKVLIVRGLTLEIETGNEGANMSTDVHGHGRSWLADQLTAAGAIVDFVVSYQRSAPVLTAQEQLLMQTAAVDGSLWLLSSSEAVKNLTQMTPQDWSQARALATHPRIAQAARDAGFGVVYESRPLLVDVMASIESRL